MCLPRFPPLTINTVDMASADEVGVLLAQARHEWKRKKRRIEYASKIRVVRIDVR